VNLVKIDLDLDLDRSKVAEVPLLDHRQ